MESSPKLIIALDFSNEKEAFNLIDKISPTDCILKIGSEMFTLFGPDFVRALVKRGFKIFLDLKFHDIPTTVAKACLACANLGVWMLNVHATGGLTMMKAAKESLSIFKNPPLLIAVTVLTSMNINDLNHLGMKTTIEEQVVHLAHLAKHANLDGVVCSAFEVKAIKEKCPAPFITVTPGIRLKDGFNQDQSRVMTPLEAKEQGSDYLVIGRPITRSEHPKEIIQSILSNLQ